MTESASGADRRLSALHPADNVVVVIEAVAEGDTVVLADVSVRVERDMALGHKLARVAISAGTPVVKFGEVIGTATEDIAPGRWVHTHNLRSNYLAGASGHDDHSRPHPTTVRTVVP